MIDFRLYLITDRKQVSKIQGVGANGCSPLHDAQHLLTAVREALKGGIKAVQLREKDMGTRELLKLAYRMRTLTEKYDARLFINDRLDIALAVGADGVHLTQNSIPADAARKVVNASRVTRHASRFLIGVSTHSLKEAKEAEKQGADFITLGPVYRTPSKLKYGKPLGADVFKNVCMKVNIPVFAIGGIKSHRVKEVKKAGAYGIAMISEILGAEDIKEKAEEIAEIVDDL